MSSAFIVAGAVPDARDHDGTSCGAQPAGACRPKFQEKRNSGRFPVRQGIQYRAIDSSGGNSAGGGLTLDMSGSGIRFSVQKRIPPGSILEVAVDWPVRLDGTCPLKMVLVGRVVRSEADFAALAILRYEFRTKGPGLTPRGALSRVGTDATRRHKRTPKYRTDQARDAASPEF